MRAFQQERAVVGRVKNCAQMIENARRGGVRRVFVFAQNWAFDGHFAVCTPTPCYRLKRAYRVAEGHQTRFASMLGEGDVGQL